MKLFEKNDKKNVNTDFTDVLKTYQLKREKEKKKIRVKIKKMIKSARDVFDPTFIAEIVIIYEELIENRYWRFAPIKDTFYYYSDGVWQNTKPFELKKTISKILRRIKKTWNRTRKQKEVLTAIKIKNGNIETERAFNPGLSPDLKYINVKKGMLEWEKGIMKGHSPDYLSTF